MIDTHCHLTYDPLCDQLEAVLQRARQAGVDRMITVGTSPDDARKAAALAAAHPQVFATVGLHPHYADQWKDRAAVVESIAQLAQHPRIVAIGEMGLDAHYPEPSITSQLRALEWQLEAVAGLPARPGRPPMPVVIHNREATDQTLAVLRGSGIDPGRFVFHCFTGTPAELDAVLAFGAMVGFTGSTTFRSAAGIADCAAGMPLDRMLVETDSPYLTPEPHRKVRPNEPCYVPFVARFIADRRGMAADDLVRHVDANAVRLFGLS